MVNSLTKFSLSVSMCFLHRIENAVSVFGSEMLSCSLNGTFLTLASSFVVALLLFLFLHFSRERDREREKKFFLHSFSCSCICTYVWIACVNVTMYRCTPLLSPIGRGRERERVQAFTKGRHVRLCKATILARRKKIKSICDPGYEHKLWIKCALQNYHCLIALAIR